MIPRTDVVGSLLRPLDVWGDEAVDRAIALQEEAGLDVVTDGEMRRRSFQAPMTDAVEGFGEVERNAFLWGEWKGEKGTKSVPRPPCLGGTGRLVRRRPLVAHEFAYLKTRTTQIPKVSLPSPGLWVNLWSPTVYPAVDSFYADLVAILREEVRELAGLGARYIQIDAPHYGLLLDPRTREFYTSRGVTLEQWIDLDNAVMDGFPDVTFGLHI